MADLLISLLLLLREKAVGDTGPIYYETDTRNFIVEPFNAISAFLFLLIVGYWVLRVRGKWRSQRFVAINMPLLAIGGVGGTLYHAFRNSEVFLVMDWLPIMLLSMACAFYFMIKATRYWWLLIVLVAGLFGGEAAIFQELGEEYQSLGININYALTGVMILVPTFLYLRQRNFFQSRLIGLAVVAFAIALVSRLIDNHGLLPMGTHFLWHTFGALASHFMIAFVYANRQREWEQGSRSLL